MSTKRRFLFGLVSSLFLAIGFVRAAERFDPVPIGPAVHSGTIEMAPLCDVWPPA